MKKRTRLKLVNSNVLFGPPPILAGEEETAYDELIGRFYAAMKRVDVIDEMLIADAVASEWESAGSKLRPHRRRSARNRSGCDRRQTRREDGGAAKDGAKIIGADFKRGRT